MKKVSPVLFLALAGVAAYLAAWPVGIDPEAWTPPPAPGFTGDFAPNTRLAALERLGGDAGYAPEDIALDAEGRIYGGMADGRIIRWSADLASHALFADTGGRPLGLHFDAQGNLIVADSYKGLLSVAPDGTIETLATEHGGLRFGFTDDVDVAADGVIYFSDASWKFGQTQYIDDLVEHRPNGRLLAYDPKTRTTSLVWDGLYFANGVAVSPEQEFVLVNETGAYRIRRVWIAGPKKGTSDFLAENLPGFPDGVSSGTGGIFWVAIASPRNALLDQLMPHPFLRKVVMRLPKTLQPAPVKYSLVLGFDRDGRLLHNLQDPAGAYAPITSAQEHAGMLYFGSIEEPGFARIPIPSA